MRTPQERSPQKNVGHHIWDLYVGKSTVMCSTKYTATHLFSLSHPKEIYAGFSIQNPAVKPVDRE